MGGSGFGMASKVEWSKNNETGCSETDDAGNNSVNEKEVTGEKIKEGQWVLRCKGWIFHEVKALSDFHSFCAVDANCD